MSVLAGARTAVRTCLRVRKGERTVVVTDILKEDIGEAVHWAAKEAGAEAILVKMLPRSRHGEEPPEPVAAIMRTADVVIAPTAYSISHTQARKEANLAGARIATMPMITEEMMSRGGMTADFREVKRHAGRLAREIGEATFVHVSSPDGTDIRFSVEGRKWVADSGLLHNRGDFGNLPGGELFVPPVEGTADGVIVVTGALAGIGILKRPVRITVRNGLAREITGGTQARAFARMLEGAGAKLDTPDNAYNLAEFGIGLNPKARLIGNPLEDEKAIGTVHLALGDNSTFGGNTRAGIHVDGIILRPRVEVDGKVLRI
ncbi:MAG: aminopeptidase [Euryarchaeota archaeon]|nr:aminopeptidase [Euryarchaeota archaeon]